jgi:hypothetical protein
MIAYADVKKILKFSYYKLPLLARKEKLVIILAWVILCAQFEFVKRKFVHFSNSYISKISPVFHLQKDGKFWALDHCSKMN